MMLILFVFYFMTLSVGHIVYHKVIERLENNELKEYEWKLRWPSLTRNHKYAAAEVLSLWDLT